MAHRNIQRLGQTQQERNGVVVQADTQAFSKGFVEGQTNLALYPGEPNESELVAIVRNLCEIAEEGWLSTQQLHHDVGTLVGWVLRQGGIMCRDHRNQLKMIRSSHATRKPGE